MILHGAAKEIMRQTLAISSINLVRMLIIANGNYYIMRMVIIAAHTQLTVIL